MSRTAVVAGHVCLDVIPQIDRDIELMPGRLFEIGSPIMATGGVVANTGLAMHILGVPTLLMGKIGNDMFGKAILDIFSSFDSQMTAGMNVLSGETTSYTLVMNLPGSDRCFLHCPGANHTFGADDILYDKLEQAALFHFGYPPLMQRTYENDGEQLVTLLARAQERGVCTSLDMAMPDPNGPSGQANWITIIERIGAHLDIFIPSSDELLYMLGRSDYGEGDNLNGDEVSALGERLLATGLAVTGLKLGSRGLYIRTAGAERLSRVAGVDLGDMNSWHNRELWFPVFNIERFVGATGAGDTTLAGFLAGLLNGLELEQAGATANMVGSLNVQAADAIGGLKSWDETQARIADTGRQSLTVTGQGWRQDASGVWCGPNDRPG